jgi:hypothetical protein
MNPREVVLAVAALAFAATSLWLGMELRAERAKASIATGFTDLAKSPATEDVGQQAYVATNSRHTSTGVSDHLDSTAVRLSGSQDEAAKRAAGLRKRLEDPRERQQFQKQAKAGLRHGYPELAKRVQLSTEESEALLDILAENELRSRTHEANCRGDLQCWIVATHEESDLRREELEAYLGTDKYQRFELYVDSLQERRSVGQLQVMLPSGKPLTEVNAERLIAEIAQERRETTAAAAARGERVDGFGTLFGSVLTSSVQDGADAQSRLESAEQFSQRLRARAARILTPEQFEVFDQMQDDLLTEMHERLREEM